MRFIPYMIQTLMFEFWQTTARYVGFVGAVPEVIELDKFIAFGLRITITLTRFEIN